MTLRQHNADLTKAYEHKLSQTGNQSAREGRYQTDGWTRVKTNRNPRLPIHPQSLICQSFQRNIVVLHLTHIELY